MIYYRHDKLCVFVWVDCGLFHGEKVKKLSQKVQGELQLLKALKNAITQRGMCDAILPFEVKKHKLQKI